MALKHLDDSDRYALNKMNSSSQKHQLGDALASSKVSFVGKYDFAVSGGAISSINLLDASGASLSLPDNFCCTNVIIDKVTSLQSADSTSDISIGINSTADALAAVDETSCDGTGFHAGIPVGTAATAVKTTAARNPVFVIANTALTAGKWYVQFEGFLSEHF